MTQGNYYIGLDLNKDNYFARGVQITDAMNLLGDPLRISSALYNSATSYQFSRYSNHSKYRYALSVTTGTSANAGIEIGRDASGAITQTIVVTPNVQITVQMEIYGSPSEEISWQIREYFGINNSSIQTLTLSTTATQYSITFTPTISRIVIRVYRTSSVVNTSFVIRNLIVTTGASVPANFNTGAPTDVYEDITDLVISASWKNGMDSPRQDVAGEARCTLVLDNLDGHFNQSGLGAELVTNGDFTSWSGGLPVGWTVTGTGSPSVTQVGFDSLFGGSGSGACNLSLSLTSGNPVQRIYQSILTIGKTYRVTFDIGASAGTAIVFYSGSTQISRMYSDVGHYEFTFVANDDEFSVGAGYFFACNITVDNISVKECPRYYGLARGTLVSIRGYIDSTEYLMYTGHLVSITPTGGRLDTHTVTMEFTDSIAELARVEYTPLSIYYNTAVSIVLAGVLESLELALPYTSLYWYLGESFLGIETYLYEGENLTIAGTTDSTILAVSNDTASNRKRGIAANSYIADLVAAEMGGRFYFDTRNGVYYFFGRNYDNSVITPTYTLTDDDYDDYNQTYGDDVINQVTIFYKQRRTGDANQVLWASESDVIVAATKTQRITGRYRDPNNELIQVAAIETEPFAENVDYTVTPAAQRSKVTVTAEANAQSVTFTIQNASGVSITVTGLQIRGTPSFSDTEQSVTAINTDSVYRHDPHEETHNIPLLSDPDMAQAMALGVASLYGTPAPYLKSITFSATKNDTRYSRALNYIIGARVNISQSFNDLSGGYVVIGEQHNLVAGGEHTHTVTWILKSVDRVAYWYLGEVGRSELGSNTIPAF